MSIFERITIKEQDLTSAGRAVASDNVAFIPGLPGSVPEDDTSYRNVNTFKTSNGVYPIQYVYAYVGNDTIPGFTPYTYLGEDRIYFYNTLTDTLYQYGDGYGYIAPDSSTGTPIYDNDYVVLDANRATYVNFDSNGK